MKLGQNCLTCFRLADKEGCFYLKANIFCGFAGEEIPVGKWSVEKCPSCKRRSTCHFQGCVYDEIETKKLQDASSCENKTEPTK